MAAGYTAFMTYMLSGDTGATNIYGYTDAIHCNYINSIHFDNLINKEFNIFFDSETDFKFLSVSGGTGFTANKFIVLAQLIDNAPYDNVDQIKPDASKWKIFDVTDQVIEYSSGQTLSSLDLTSNVFRIPIAEYNLASNYDLSYLNYPSEPPSSMNEGEILPLSFGDETYFIGNVTTSIEAIAYTMDLAINLPLEQFNSTTNETWDGESKVSISEIGLYDDNNNLVGIAKLNNPISKDSSISRTIVFGLDF